MLTEDQKQRILDLAQNFTCLQIAAETKLNATEIYGFMKRQGISLLTEGDIIMNRLYKEAHKYSRAEMKQRLNITEPTMEKYVKETGVTFKGEGLPKPIGSFTDKRREYELREAIQDRYYITGRKCIKDKYTQSASPFGIADELK